MDSQFSFLDGLSDVGGIVHENFKGKVQPHLEHIGPTLALFNRVGPGDYTLTGSKLVFAGDVTYSGGAMATPSGELPRHQYADAVNFETTPVRTYVRRAVDNFNVQRFQGDGTFESFIGRVMEQMWDAFDRMQNRHVHGSSDGTVCLCSSRSSQTEVVVKDGYGHSGVSPVMFLEPGMDLAWLDASNSYAVGGAAEISSIDYDTSATTATITFASNFDDGGTTIAADDPLVFPTTNDTSASYFAQERGNAPLGLFDLIDPNEDNSSYLGVSESTYPRVRPIRDSTANWGEVAFMEFATKIESKSNSPVTPQTHTFVAQPAAVIELAKTLVPYTQIQQKGKTLDGGWETVRVAGHDIVKDTYAPHDILYALCMQDACVADLDGDPKVWSGDGSQFSRLADVDAKEWYAYHFVQRFLKRRNRCGSLKLTSISDGADYDASPNY